MNSRPFKHLVALSVITLSGFTLQSVCAGDFEDGVALYEQQEFTEAAKSFQSAANKGNADAQFNLGLMYLNGEGIEQDYQKHAHCFSNLRNKIMSGRKSIWRVCMQKPKALHQTTRPPLSGSQKQQNSVTPTHNTALVFYM
jgi:hypothetical protein